MQQNAVLAFEAGQAPQPADSFRMDDTAMGILFAREYRERLLYVPQRGCWYRYEEGGYVADTLNYVQEYGKEFVDRRVAAMVAAIEEPGGRLRCERALTHLRNNSGRERMLRAASSIPLMCADITDFDYAGDYILAKNGVLDLHFGELLPHSPVWLMTKRLSAAFDPGARLERWDAFVLEIMNGDEEAARFLQKAAGYALCGSPTEDCLFLLYGEKTRNGKSTFLSALRGVLGSYAASVQPETLMERERHAAGPSSDIARLSGVRLVQINEPPKNMRLNEALVKTLTGGDKITARYLHQEFFEFSPRFVLFMNTNYLPRVRDLSIFTSGRMHCIPFPVHFSPEKQDSGLLEAFSTEEAKSAILNWLLAGLALYRKEGLKNPPRAVLEATTGYREDMDVFAGFLEEQLLHAPGAKTPVRKLYQAYEGWSRDGGHTPMSEKSFSQEMRRRGYEAHRTKAYVCYLNVCLMAELPFAGCTV